MFMPCFIHSINKMHFMNRNMTLRLILLLIFTLPALSLFGQTRYQEENGVFLTNGIGGIGYRVASHFDISASYGEDLYDRDRGKISLAGSFTNFLNPRKTWGYTLGTELSYLTTNITNTNRFTPNLNSSVFRIIKLSESFDLVPSLSGFISFPEFDHQAFGAEFTIPVSIKVFGDKRFIIGPGVKLGQTNVNSIQIGQDSFQRTEKVFRFGLMSLGFNF